MALQEFPDSLWDQNEVSQKEVVSSEAEARSE